MKIYTKPVFELDYEEDKAWEMVVAMLEKMADVMMDKDSAEFRAEVMDVTMRLYDIRGRIDADAE